MEYHPTTQPHLHPPNPYSYTTSTNTNTTAHPKHQPPPPPLPQPQPLPYYPNYAIDNTITTNPYHYNYQNAHPPNPNPYPNTPVGLQPPGVDHYGGVHSYEHFSQAIHQYGADPVAYGGIGQAAITHPTVPAGHVPPANPVPRVKYQGLGYINLKKNNKKKKVVKVVQPVHCQVCKIDLNSQEVLNSHKLGRKHKKNLEKLRESITPQPAQPPKAAIPTPVPTPGVKTGKRKKASASDADLEIKKKKVIEGGAAQDAVKICTICNVVCNSQLVYSYHLAGHKHAAMLKKQQGA